MPETMKRQQKNKYPGGGDKKRQTKSTVKATGTGEAGPTAGGRRIHREKAPKLRNETSILRAIVDHTDVMIAYLDRKFNFIWVNSAYAEACRMAPREMVGRNHFDLYPHPENEAIFTRVRESGEPVFFKEKPFVFPDQPERGATYWDWSLVPVPDKDGKVASLVFSLRETTHFIKTRQELTDSEERFRAMTETSMDIIFQVDHEGRISYVSPAVSSLGYGQDEVIGRSINDFVIPEDIREARGALMRVLKGDKIKLLELRLLKADLEIADCEINISPVIRAGSIVGVQGITRDVTERKKAEEKIRKLARFPAENPFPVMRIDREGVILYANQAGRPLLETWGITAGELLPEEVRSHVIDTFASRRIREIEQRCGDRILALNLVPVIDGNFINIYGLDVTQRKQVEKDLQNLNAALRGITVIFLAGMQCETEEELAEETLMAAEQLTGSKAGFIGEIGPDGRLRDLAVSDPGWRLCNRPYAQGAGKGAGNSGIADLCGRIINESRSLLTNEPGEQSTSGDTPEEHFPVSAFLGVPLNYRDKTIGLIGLANRDGGYGEEQLDIVRAMAPAFVETLFKSRAEKALQESEARERQNAGILKQFLDFSPIPMWIAHDPECRTISVNLAAARLMGVDKDANVSRHFGTSGKASQIRIFRDGRELATEETPLHYAVTHGTAVKDIEIELLRADGRCIRILGASTALFDADGRVTGGISAYIDITERTKLEEKLLQAKEEWEMTFNTVPDLIAVLDAEYRIVRVNRAMADRAGLDPEEFVGRKCYELIHGAAEPVEKCPYIMTCKDGTEHRSELFEHRMGGYFLVTTSPLFDDQGRMSGAIHVARDITEQKKAEDEINSLNLELQQSLSQLETANENLRRSNEDLQHFASIVSHDLQEPLRTVASFVQLLGRRYGDALDDKGVIFMQHVVDGTNHMQRLLNDLLSYSRVGGGKLDLRPVPLQAIVTDVKHKLDRRIKETRAEIRSSGLPVVYGDQLQLFTLLQNLVSNGLKYRRPDAPPRINITARQDNGNECIVCVSDNGLGIGAQHIERIFLIFQRLHLRNEYEGTGIGLAICKKIVERHGGRIWAESEPGRGSDFYFTLQLPKEENDR